jgi:tRNA (guanine37-N1)-methyltransferase
LQDNVLNNPETHNSESFQNDLLEHDQFTRPSIWNAPDGSSHKVPEELLNGNHSVIEKWKKSNSEQNTSKNRQDLWKNYLKNKKNE